MPAAGMQARLYLQDSSSTWQDFSQYATSDALKQKFDTIEVTVKRDSAGNVIGAKQYIPGLSDATIDLEGPWDPSLDGIIAGIIQKVTGFRYLPAGNSGPAGTNVRYSGQAIVTAYEIDAPVNGEVKAKISLQVTGAITRDLV